MPLADLYNVPKTTSERLIWSFHNADQHTQILSNLISQKNTFLAVYLLDPMNEGRLDTWLQIHQQAHNDFTEQLGIIGNDLTDVDFQNPNQLNAWVWLHGEEHRQAASKLGF